MSWDASLDQAEQALEKLLQKYERDLPKAIRSISDDIREINKELERLQRIEGNIRLKKNTSDMDSRRIHELTDNINNLIQIKDIYAKEIFNLQSRYLENEKDVFNSLSIIGSIIDGSKEVKDEEFKTKINKTSYDLSIGLIKKCLNDKEEHKYAINRAIQYAIKSRESLSSHSLDRSEILAEILILTHPHISKERLKIKIRMAIEAILYGIAASGIYKMLYDMYSTMNPTAMSHAYGKIFLRAKQEAEQRGVLKELTELTGSLEETEDIFELLFIVTFRN